jgi:hypothetical protein
MEEWITWNNDYGNHYRFVEKDGHPDFGQIFYNPNTDILFIRKVVHEFESKDCQILERPKSLRHCVYVGNL